jgi:putative acetyltransferase
MLIRPFAVGDEAALYAVFHSAIHDVASRDYTPAQVDAWAPPPATGNDERWARRVQGIRPFVVEIDGRIVAYADVQSNGYIDHFFVSGAAARRGIGTALMNRIHEAAAAQQIAELTSHVSITAQPFFARFGFVLVEPRSVVIDGVSLSNALMAKTLAGGAAR